MHPAAAVPGPVNSSSGGMGSPALHYQANIEMGRGGMAASGLMVQSGDTLTTDTKFTVLSRLTSSCVKDTTNLIQDKGYPINVVVNEGPGLIFKEVPPDFDVIILTIIKVMIRCFCFQGNALLQQVMDCSSYKLWIVSSTFLQVIIQIHY